MGAFFEWTGPTILEKAMAQSELDGEVTGVTEPLDDAAIVDPVVVAEVPEVEVWVLTHHLVVEAGDGVSVLLPTHRAMRGEVLTEPVRRAHHRKAQSGGHLPLGAIVDPSVPWTVGPPIAELGGAPTLVGSMRSVERTLEGGLATGAAMRAVAIPYALWANRTPGPMAVWIAKDPAAAKPAPAPTIAHRAKASSSFGGDLAALSDQLEPSSSGDHEHPFLHWWPRMGTEETITYEFAEPTRVRAVEVYWFDDSPISIWFDEPARSPWKF